jgi:glutamate N-acetyltransferase/amino-acid N-acetyltransferase
MEVAKSVSVRGVVVNSGNANTCNGPRGMVDVLTTANAAAGVMGVDNSDIFVCSTGVIGLPLPIAAVTRGIGALLSALKADGWEDAARAIMTTDTMPKLSGVKLDIGGKTVTIVGIAKGAGMIQPNMATMLSFVATDADISKPMLKAALKSANGMSFNRITVDGDSSTNDSVILLANGVAGNKRIEKPGKDYTAFVDGLTRVMSELARMIIKDGEGATKLVEVRVTGAATERDADTAARAIANSPLVKTAMFASDPNWGRILCAAGYSGAKLDPDAVSIAFDKVFMVKRGMGLGPKAEAKVAKVMQKDEYAITVDLGVGKASVMILTCDLGYEYVKINAEYRS